MSTFAEPFEAMEAILGDAYANLSELGEGPTTSEILLAVAQVQATCALVHAVRELTAEVRKLRETDLQ